MVIKVVSPGILPSDIKYDAVCTHCKCRFEFTGADGKITSDQRDGAFITVPCPTCNRTVSQKSRSPDDELRRRQNNNVDPY